MLFIEIILKDQLNKLVIFKLKKLIRKYQSIEKKLEKLDKKIKKNKNEIIFFIIIY